MTASPASESKLRTPRLLLALICAAAGVAAGEINPSDGLRELLERATRADLETRAATALRRELSDFFARDPKPALASGVALLAGSSALGAPERKLLFEALSEQPWSAVREASQAAIGAAPPPATLLRAQVELTAHLAPASELGTLLDLLEAVPETIDERARGAALETFLGRHPSGSSDLDRAARARSLPLSLALVRALGKCRDTQALDFLCELAEREPECADLVLAQLQRIGPGPHEATNRAICAAAGASFGSARAQTASAAARTLGRFAAAEAADALLAGLESEHASVREACEWALSEMSGLRPMGGPAAWRRWLEGEQQWRAVDLPNVGLALESGNEASIVQALNSLSKHRLFRHELAQRIAPSVLHAKSDVRVAACRALSELGSLLCARELERALSYPDEATRAAARAALEVLLERPLEADPKRLGRQLGLEN